MTLQLPPVAVLVPMREWAYTVPMFALFNMVKTLPPGSTLDTTSGNPSDTIAARNMLASRFLAHPSGYRYALWLDSDMIPEPNLANRMLAAAVAGDLDMLAAPYPQRTPPHAPTYRLVDAERDLTGLPARHGVVELAMCGFGTVVVHRRLFENMTPPFFSNGVVDDSGNYVAGPHPLGPAEDASFCYRARRSGFRIWLDRDLEGAVSHLTLATVSMREGGVTGGTLAQ